MDKYIFLDIDGVIATPETVEEGTWGLTKSKQELLGKILSETGAKIVLSSSWRHKGQRFRPPFVIGGRGYCR